MRHPIGWIFLAAALTACSDEHWYAYDALSVPFTGPGRVTLEVTTTAAAFPHDRYDEAVRATFRRGVLSPADPDREVLLFGDHGVNVLDAWADCAPDADCVTWLDFDIACEEPCEGVFRADAFLATHWLAEPDRGGELTLAVVDPNPDGADGP